MLDFKKERETKKITLRQIAEQAKVDFSEVYRFDNHGFVLLDTATMEKIVQAFSTLTQHTYRLSDFFVPPTSNQRTNDPKTVALGARGGTGSLTLMPSILNDTERRQQWAKQQQTHHQPKTSQATQT